MIERSVVLAILLAVGCGGSPAADTDRGAAGGQTVTSDPSSSPSEKVFFPEVRQDGGLDSVPEAMGGGKLVLDDKGCLRMLPGGGPENGWVPVWPPYLEPETGGGGVVRIVDERSGRTVGEVGEGISMGGGDVSKEALRENDILDERTWRELFERCPPGYSYFIVGEGVHITRPG